MWVLRDATHRSSSETDEGHLALQPVACECDGLEDVAQLSMHVHLAPQSLEVLWLLQRLWESRPFAWNHLNIHTQGLEEWICETYTDTQRDVRY